MTLTAGRPAARTDRHVGEVVLEVSGLRTEIPTRNGVVPAVDGVDLVIHRGEVVALVGESGSGKSMTALSITRLLPPAARMRARTMRLRDVDLLALSEERMNGVRGARIAMLFQHPQANLDPTCEIGEQVAESARLHRHASRSEAWRQGVELLRSVGIPEAARRAHAYAHQMSGGMAQRVMIAAALSAGPELLIADEPTTALDVTVQAQILRVLGKMRRDAALSILLITHDLGIVAALADRVAVMYAGHIVEEAPTRTILEHPQHPYTKALLRASLLIPDEHGRLYSIPGGPPAPGTRIAGCRFRARCHVADEMGVATHCESNEPELTLIGDDHLTRCWACHGTQED